MVKVSFNPINNKQEIGRIFKGSFLISLFFVLLISVSDAKGGNQFDCGIIERTPSEQVTFSEVKKAFNEKKDFDLSCLELAAEKHFFNLASFLIEEYYSKNDIDTLDVIENQISKLKRKQSKLYKELARMDREALVIKPAFKWAQSLDNVFIETKFSHRLDAPACVDIFDQKIKITEKHLNLTAKCRQGDDTIHYKMYLNLYDNINVSASSWEKQSAGRIYVHLKKKILPNRWTKLFLNDEDEKPGRVMLWKEMHDKYSKSLENYAKQFREEEDDYDDFDYFVAREEGRDLQPKMKMTKTETFQTVDVKDQIETVDVTDEMREYFESPGFKDKLMSGNLGGNYDFDEDEYEYYDDDDEYDEDIYYDGDGEEFDEYTHHGEDL